MIFSKWLFEVFPYIAAVACVAGAVYRFRFRAFSVSSLSSQFLESRKLFWGSVPWHYGILVVLLGHVVAFLWPGAILSLGSVPARLRALEAVALAFGLLAVFGLVLLVWRRISDRRVRAVTTVVDVGILALLLVQVATGVCIAVLHRWGSSWFASALTPYLWSLVKLAPESGRIASMPILVKIHVIDAFLLLALIPFSRLAHVLSIPLPYLFRPPQRVVWNRRDAESD